MASQVQAVLRGAPPFVVIDLLGEITAFADEAITSAYRAADAQGAHHILFNFAGADYINSAGISILIGILTETRATQQHLLMTGLSPHYRKIFEMMGLSKYAPIFDSEEAARESTESA